MIPTIVSIGDLQSELQHVRCESIESVRPSPKSVPQIIICRNVSGQAARELIELASKGINLDPADWICLTEGRDEKSHGCAVFQISHLQDLHRRHRTTSVFGELIPLPVPEASWLHDWRGYEVFDQTFVECSMQDGLLKYIVIQICAQLAGRSAFRASGRVFAVSSSSRQFIRSAQIPIRHPIGKRGTEGTRLTAASLSVCYLSSSMGSSAGASSVDLSYSSRPITRAYNEWLSSATSSATVPLVSNIEVPDFIEERTSARTFSKTPIDSRALATVMRMGAGRPDRTRYDDNNKAEHRVYPTAGGLASVHPIALIKRVTGVRPGLYAYDASSDAMRQLNVGPFLLEQGSAFHEKIENCAVAMLLVADISTLSAKYFDRAARLALLEAGHLAQSLITAASYLGLSTCPLSGFDEESLVERLRLPAPWLYIPYILLIGNV